MESPPRNVSTRSTEGNVDNDNPKSGSARLRAVIDSASDPPAVPAPPACPAKSPSSNMLSAAVMLIDPALLATGTRARAPFSASISNSVLVPETSMREPASVTTVPRFAVMFTLPPSDTLPMRRPSVSGASFTLPVAESALCAPSQIDCAGE